MNSQNKLTLSILLALALGACCGLGVHYLGPDPAAVAGELRLVSTVFLRLVKMILAPLVFSTLVVGIGKMGAASDVGRVGVKAMSWFVLASLLSLVLGLAMVNLLQPGIRPAALMPLPASGATGISGAGMSVESFLTHLVPTSIVEAMAHNEILQIVAFSLVFGAACAQLGTRAAPLIAVLDVVAHAMLGVTGFVMRLAPLAVFAAVAAEIAHEGLGILSSYGIFMLDFYAGIAALWAVLIVIGVFLLGPAFLALLREVRQPILLAFSTASSEAALPRTLEALERCGVSNRIASFVLPLGYSFNLDGSMMYCTFATLFIAQSYGISLSLGTQITMMLLLMLTSKGMAGVPRASLVVIAATLQQFHLPEGGIVLLLGVDHFLDMARSATNVVGNTLATALVARWEGERLLTSPSASHDRAEARSCVSPLPSQNSN